MISTISLFLKSASKPRIRYCINEYSSSLNLKDNFRNAMSSSARGSNSQQTMCLDDYDVIGFDLDHTLCKYKIKPVAQLVYSIMCNFLIREKKYPEELFESYESSARFYQRGVVIDMEQGNFLKLGEDFSILRATHGTRVLTKQEIQDSYGLEEIWEPTKNILYQLCERKSQPRVFRSLQDYFVIPAPYICARLVDYLDTKSNGRSDYFSVWYDVYESISDMFQRERFAENQGGYFSTLRENLPLYVQKCDKNLIEWLKRLKDNKRVFLLTGSHCDYASFLLNYIIGENWKDFFDICITFGRKPGFFYESPQNRPFLLLEGIEEKSPVQGVNLESKGIYSQGNWTELQEFFARVCKKSNPKMLYFGDVIMDDVYPGPHFSRCDTVAIVEEMAAEGMMGVERDVEIVDELASDVWGSFFVDSKDGVGKLPFWSSVLMKYSRLSIPSLAHMSKISLKQQVPAFTSMSSSNLDGFYPIPPAVFGDIKLNSKM